MDEKVSGVSNLTVVNIWKYSIGKKIKMNMNLKGSLLSTQLKLYESIHQIKFTLYDWGYGLLQSGLISP